MTRPALAARAPSTAPARSDPLQVRVLAVLRPQFTVAVIVPDPGDLVLGGRRCAVAGCDRLVQGRGMCGSHYSRWRKSGGPDVTAFIATTAPLAAHSGLHPTQCYDLRGLPRALRLEVAYALQCRLDERRAGLRPGQVTRAVKVLAGSGASSLLDHSLRYWLAKAGQRPGRPGACGTPRPARSCVTPTSASMTSPKARAATTSTTAIPGTPAG